MDKASVRLLLEAYRDQDADDPIFTEALREVAADPELAAWFEETRRFDAVIGAKFQELPVPPEVPGHILLGYRAEEARPPTRRWTSTWVMTGAAAAVVVLALCLWQTRARRREPVAGLELQAISYSRQMPALQFVCFDAGAVARWVNSQPAARQLGLSLPKPPKSLSMEMIGSSVVDWDGRPVVMVCLQNGKRMALLYILDAGNAGAMPDGASETMQHDDWTVRTTRVNGQLRLLTVKGKPEDLDYSMPF